MAAVGGRVKDLCEEATCPVCLDYFKDPVIITKCGHNFCRACLTQCWGESKTEASCPQCRETFQQRSLIPNRQLSSFVEITKGLSLQGDKGGERKGRVCEKHQEPLKLFCKDDKNPICVVCDRAKEHKGHEVIPVEEASEEYKDKICRCLKNLKKERQKIMAYKEVTVKESQHLLKQIEAEKRKTVAEFRQLHDFLVEQEKLLLSQMEEVAKEVARKRDEHLTKLSEELSSLESTIQEMEEKHQQPPGELLQDVRSMLQRIEERGNFENPVAFPVSLKWRFWDSHDINPFLEGVMKQFKDALLSGQQLQKANITLNPDTAYQGVTLSKDHNSVAYENKLQDLPDNPERFSKRPVVLGREEFTAGRHFWEVILGNEEEWLVGVARKSVRRKERFDCAPEEGIWAVGRWEGGYWVANHPCYPPLSLRKELKRIRVSLNCPGGRVAFYDANTGAHLHTFSAASFAGQTLLPFFWLCKKAHFSISP